MFATPLNINLFKEVKTVYTQQWKPFKGTQERIYNTCRDAKYRIVANGGGKGGGKTEVVIYSQIQDMAEYGEEYAGLWLRSTFRQSKSLLKRVYKCIKKEGLKAFKNESEGTITMSNGAVLRFSYADGGKASNNWHGENFNRIIMDEPQQFLDLASVMNNAGSCMRGASGKIKPKMILNFNPIGTGSKYLKDNFVVYGDGVDKYISVGKQGYTQIFNKSLPTDNSFILENDPEYISWLENLPSKLREAWLNGNFDIEYDPLPFEKIRRIKQVFADATFAYLDPAIKGNDYTAITCGVQGVDGNIYIAGRAWHLSWRASIPYIKEFIEDCNVSQLYYESNIVGDVFEEMLGANHGLQNVVGLHESTNKKVRIIQAGLIAENIVMLENLCNKDYIDTLTAWNEKAKTDDSADSLSGFLRELIDLR